MISENVPKIAESKIAHNLGHIVYGPIKSIRFNSPDVDMTNIWVIQVEEIVCDASNNQEVVYTFENSRLSNVTFQQRKAVND